MALLDRAEGRGVTEELPEAGVGDFSLLVGDKMTAASAQSQRPRASTALETVPSSQRLEPEQPPPTSVAPSFLETSGAFLGTPRPGIVERCLAAQVACESTCRWP